MGAFLAPLAQPACIRIVLLQTMCDEGRFRRREAPLTPSSPAWLLTYESPEYSSHATIFVYLARRRAHAAGKTTSQRANQRRSVLFPQAESIQKRTTDWAPKQAPPSPWLDTQGTSDAKHNCLGLLLPLFGTSLRVAQ